MTPMPTPNQSVQKRMMSVAATATSWVISGVVMRARSIAVMPISAAPRPPGRKETEPISVAAASTKVAVSSRRGVAANPSPMRTRKKATHSISQETKPIAAAKRSGFGRSSQ